MCIWVPLRGTHYRSRLFLYYSWSHVHSPSARYRLNAPPLGGAYVHPFGVHINYARNNGAPSVPHMHILRVCINGCPKGAPTMTYGHPFYFVVARSLAFGSLPAPMHTRGVHMGANQAPITTHAKSYPLGNNPLG